MFKKKILSTLLAVGLSATFLVGCGAGDEGTASNSDKVNVKLLVTGALGDKGINDSANAGAEKIEDVLKNFGFDLTSRGEVIPLEVFVEIVNNL